MKPTRIDTARRARALCAWTSAFGLALALTAAPATPLGAAETASGAAAGAYTVELFDQAPYFQPKRLKIDPGSTVTWVNRGPGLIHTVVVWSAEGEDHSGPIGPGTSWSHTFSGDAVVKTSCEIHPYMYGIVVVGDPPASLISAIEAQAGVPSSPGVSVEVVEFPIPIPDAVPGIVSIDRQDNVWVTLGGGGWGNIAHPPLPHFGRLTADGDFTAYSTPTPASGPSGLLVGDGGLIYITALMAGKIIRFDPASGSIEETSVPTEPSWPTGLDLAADGSLWFSETKGDKVGRLSPDGVISEIRVPTEGAHPTGLGIDSKGNVWISERDGSKIGCLRPDGTFIEYQIPTPRAKPSGLHVDSQDRIWFAEREGNKIGMIRDGVVTEYPLPEPKSGPFFPVEDANGLIWFSEVYANRLGVLDPESGAIVKIALPTPDSWPGGLAFDSQGTLWFAEHLGNKVGMILNPAKAAREAFAQRATEQRDPVAVTAHAHDGAETVATTDQSNH